MLFQVILLLALTIALSACSGDKAGEDSSSSSITIGIPQDLESSLDPHKAVAAGTKEVLFNVFEGLVKPDSDGNLNPAVASNVEMIGTGEGYIFTLRDGITFHDGSMVTVEDVQYSIERCADTSDGTPLVEAYSNIQEVNVVDEKTIEILLVEPDTEFLAYMTTAIIPMSNENPDENPIGTGPYAYVSRSAQENFVVEKYDDYWGTPAYIQDVTFKVVANTDTIVMNLLGGSIDLFARVTTDQANELGDDFTIYEGTMNLVQALYLNHEAEPFDNLLVRQAMSYAVDQQEIMDMISDGKGVEIGSSMFPAFGKYYDEDLADVYNQDIELAKELLAEAGYPDGFTFEMTVPSNYQQHIDTAQVLVEQLKEVGITAEIVLVDWDTWVNDVYLNRNYQSTVIGVDAASLTASALLDRFTSTSSVNFINFYNEEYDHAYASARASVNDEEQIQYYKLCQAILTEEAANVYLQDMVELVALNSDYAGYEFYPLYVLDVSKLYLVSQMN